MDEATRHAVAAFRSEADLPLDIGPRRGSVINPLEHFRSESAGHDVGRWHVAAAALPVRTRHQSRHRGTLLTALGGAAAAATVVVLLLVGSSVRLPWFTPPDGATASTIAAAPATDATPVAAPSAAGTSPVNAPPTAAVSPGNAESLDASSIESDSEAVRTADPARAVDVTRPVSIDVAGLTIVARAERPPGGSIDGVTPAAGQTLANAPTTPSRAGAGFAATARPAAPAIESGRPTGVPVTPAVLPASSDNAASPASSPPLREAVNSAPATVPIESRSPSPAPGGASASNDSRAVLAAADANAATPASSAGAAPSVVSATVTPTAAIERTLKGYQAAFSRLDVEAVHAVWPTVDMKALAKAFDQVHREDLTFDACEVTVTGTTAVASCGGTTAYVPKVGSKSARVERHRWRISLHRSGEQWVVTRVDVSAR